MLLKRGLEKIYSTDLADLGDDDIALGLMKKAVTGHMF